MESSAKGFLVAIARRALLGRGNDNSRHRDDSGEVVGQQKLTLDGVPDTFRLLLFDDKNSGTSKSNDKSFKEQITHIRQDFDWDCGIVCLQMAFSFLTEADHAVCTQRTMDRSWLERKIGTQSTWTIDLVAILDQLQGEQEKFHLTSFEYLFCSKQIALNPNLEALGYYSHSFAEDASRVQRLYNKLVAHSSHRMLQHENLSLDIVLFCIRHETCVAIILIDNNILQSKVKVVCHEEATSPFVGHFVLLLRMIGDKEVVLHDPGRPRSITVSTDVLQEAWKAPGTDSDVIFVARR